MPPTARIVVESQLYLALMVHLIYTNFFTRDTYYPPFGTDLPTGTSESDR